MRHRSPAPAVGILAATLALTALSGCIVVHIDGLDAATWASMGSLGAQDLDFESRTITQTFPADAGVVRLGNIAGDVTIEQGAGPEILVEATVYAQARTAAGTARMLEEVAWRPHTRGDRTTHWLSIPFDRLDEIHYPAMRNGHVRTRIAGEEVKITSDDDDPVFFANLTITCPAGVELDVRNVVGHVNGYSLEGDFDINTNWGNVDLTEVTGSLSIDTSTGDIALGTVNGDLDIDTATGDVAIQSLTGNVTLDISAADVTITQVDADRLDLDTGSGDLVVGSGRIASLQIDSGSGDIYLNGVEFNDFNADVGSGDIEITSSLAEARRIDVDTGSGDVHIYGGPDAGFQLDADISTGDVHVGYTDAQLDHNRRRITGARRGNAATLITIDTGSGDCTIRPR